MNQVSYDQVCGVAPADSEEGPATGVLQAVGFRVDSPAMGTRVPTPCRIPLIGPFAFKGRTPHDSKGLRGPRGRKHPRPGLAPRVLPLVPQGDIPYSPNWGSSYVVAAICTLDAGLITREGDNASAAGRRSGQPIALVKTGRDVRVKGVIQCFPSDSKALIQSLTTGQAGMTVGVGSSLIYREQSRR
jgi:hypothetical protein